MHLAPPKPLIRARSVVQVHPGPPSKSLVNTRLFSLFPSWGILLKKPICQLFANFRIDRMALHSGALRPFEPATSCVTVRRSNQRNYSPKLTKNGFPLLPTSLQCLALPCTALHVLRRERAAFWT